MRVNRLEDIENFIIENKSAKLDDLCIIFEVSKNTIRRDIDELLKKGSIKKVYGGVMSLHDESKLIPYKTRIDKNYEFKLEAAKKAAQLVEDNDVIFIDSGSTTVLMLDFLYDKKVTIITHNIEVLSKAFDMCNIDVIMLPGRLNRDTNSLADATTTEELLSYNISKGFFASSGISINNGVTNFYIQEAKIKKVALLKSNYKVLVIDHTKFDESSLVTFSNINAFDCLISDTIPIEYQEYLSNNDINYK